MNHFLKNLRKKRFSFSAEIIPPRNGVDFADVFQQIESFSQAGFDFISVTHGAGGSLRGGTLPICHFAQNKAGITGIAHLTCRGVTREDLENSLIDHHYFGIHNILALRGDPPDGIGAAFRNVPGGFSYAHELIELISNMNRGRYLVRKGFDQKQPYKEGLSTNFCIGSACYPEDPQDQDIEYLKIKKEKGAHFSISQLIYDTDILEIFFKKAKNLWGDEFPIIPGIRIPHSYSQLKRMEEKFLVNVPKQLLLSMKKAEERSIEAMHDAGLDWAARFVEKAMSWGMQGVHIFVMGKPELALRLKQHFS